MDYNFSPVCFISNNQLEEICIEIERQGYFSLDMELTGVKTLSDALSRIASLPCLDPPLVGQINLDAFKDSFGGGLISLGKMKYAIILKDVCEFKKYDPFSFAQLMDVFDCIHQDLTHENVEMTIFLTGNEV